MPLTLPRRRRLPARRAAPGRAAVAACALLLLSAGAAAAASGVPVVAAPAFHPASELERLQYLGRARPDVAIVQLLRLADTLPVEDPRHLQALVEIGAEYVAINRGDALERTAARIDQLSDRLALARPAAMLLRGLWMQSHNEVGKAERQLIEADALLTDGGPNYLRTRLEIGQGQVASRRGHYDEAMRHLDRALRIIDQSGPVFARIDVRHLIVVLLTDAGQYDRAMAVNHELLQLSESIGDEIGLSHAYGNRAIQLTNTNGDALADWRVALEHARRGGNRHQIVLASANIADYYLNHGDYRAAYDLSQQVLPLARDSDDLQAQTVAYANIGLALISMKRKDEGIPFVLQSMAIDERAGSLGGLAESSRELGVYLERAGYLSDAVAAYHQYRQLSDELDQEDRQRGLIELQESLANEKRQHELEMLGSENRLKDEQLLNHVLHVREWAAAGLVGLLTLVVMGLLARRLRLRNRLLSARNELLRQQAEIDPLTGLSNRHHLQAVLARRSEPALAGALYLLDVDHFKRINDRCGHAGGDAVLVEIARRLREVLRDGDLVVRWGGEEFLVLVPPLPAHEAEALARRLLEALATKPVQHEGLAVPISASIGVARFPLATRAPHGELAIGWERAVSLVDAAMYLAKSHGRNGACVIRRIDVHPDAIDTVAEHLEQAAADGRVELHFEAGPQWQKTAA